VKWRQSLVVAGVITVGIFTVARMRAQAPRIAEEYVQRRFDDDERRMDRIDTHLDHVDATAQEHTKEIQKAEIDFVNAQATAHSDDTKWHEVIVGLIGLATAAMRVGRSRKPRPHE
jgi:hypothetical protein